jgi:hypothetical protein
MRLTDRFPGDDEIDKGTMIECGLDPHNYHPDDERYLRFHFVYDQWECVDCDTLIPHVEGKRYYYTPDTGNYDSEKPLTTRKRQILKNQRQERAGQLRLFENKKE